MKRYYYLYVTGSISDIIASLTNMIRPVWANKRESRCGFMDWLFLVL
jgi:hypothetical protein